MCYVITPAGLARLGAAGRLEAPTVDDRSAEQPRSRHPLSRGEQRLRQARHDVHVAGWALALIRMAGDGRSILRGPEQAALSPPLHSTADGRVALGLVDLRLPGGRTPHDFLRTDPTGESAELTRFETTRPDAIVEVSAAASAQATATDVFVELDDRLAVGRALSKLERYDHFLAGWSAHTARYGRRLQAVPLVVFVCRDRPRARACARRADEALRACRAYAGEYPFDWEYPGRNAIVFVSERDIHEEMPLAYGVHALPPETRVLAAQGDPRAAEASAVPTEILAAPERRAGFDEGCEG